MTNLVSVCNDYGLAYYLYIIRQVLRIIQFVAPIIAIVMLTVRLITTMINPNDQKNNKRLFNILFALVIIFFVPVIVDLGVSLVSGSSISACWLDSKNVYNPPLFNTTLTSKSSDVSDIFNKKLITTIKIKSTAKKGSNNTSNFKTNTVSNGKKYKLTTADIKYLAAICKREQGSADGMRGEANLIANRYELYGSQHKSVVDYVKSGWFGKSYVAPSNDATAISIVKSVFVQGNRTVPLYIDEHDCWFCNKSQKNRCSNGNMGDICTVSGKSSKSYITNRNNYKQDKTIITNPYGSTYTFYYFPASNSDPFGYTDEAYKTVKSLNR